MDEIARVWDTSDNIIERTRAEEHRLLVQALSNCRIITLGTFEKRLRLR